MIKEPNTRPISHKQLVPEVKGIFAGLVMAESKCIEVVNAQSSNTDKDHQLSNEQWKALIVLHRTLLHEHHDFFLASQSIMTLFDPILSSSATQLQPIDAAYVRIQGILITGKNKELLEPSLEEFYGLLDAQIGRTTKRWSGYYIGITNGCLLLEYGSDSNVLISAMRRRSDETDTTMAESVSRNPAANDTFLKALAFFRRTYEIVIRRWGDMNTLPYIHATLVFIEYMTTVPGAMAHLEESFPWKLTAVMLNLLKKSSTSDSKIGRSNFPRQPEDKMPRPLPEDFAMRGLLYTENYFPQDGFSNDKIEEDERYFEVASMTEERRERILWLGRNIASSGTGLVFNDQSKQFEVHDKYDFEVKEDLLTQAVPRP
ncbi:hypothetical protein S40293_09648 [Stachybotrys chartarum IBT 40293]|nr:hypothetical protein S40293_09648 [Stachybotrys chartarum IBT 40293]